MPQPSEPELSVSSSRIGDAGGTAFSVRDGASPRTLAGPEPPSQTASTTRIPPTHRRGSHDTAESKG